jgi:hypothetical protein
MGKKGHWTSKATKGILEQPDLEKSRATTATAVGNPRARKKRRPHQLWWHFLRSDRI